MHRIFLLSFSFFPDILTGFHRTRESPRIEQELG